MALLNPRGAPAWRTGALAGVTWLLAAAMALAQGPSLEYAVKANYLCKFGPFVEWPPGVFANATSPFNVCVMGEDPFGSALDEATRGQVVAGHPVAVRRLRTIAAAPGCQVLYVGHVRAQTATEMLQLLRGAPILTVTDAPQGGGVIRFLLQGGRVRFAIDAATAQSDGLAISSKLLELATQPAGRP